MNIYAVIVAGGSGKRMGSEIPKQFMELSGKPVLMQTMQVFHQFNNQIDIILVLPENQPDYWQKLCKKHDFNLPHRVTTGGKHRFQSVKNGLDLIEDDGIVFIHDGVRPLVNQETIRDCHKIAMETGNAIPVFAVSESVRIISGEDSKPINREEVFLVQTPQTFRVSSIKEAYNQPYNASFTDDASVFESAGHKINLTRGNRENIKITWPSDLILAEAIISGKYLKLNA